MLPGGLKVKKVKLTLEWNEDHLDDISYPTLLRWKLKELGQDCCQCCGTTHRLSVDHVVPKVMGGGDYICNTQVLCTTCNQAKGEKIINYTQNESVDRYIKLWRKMHTGSKKINKKNHYVSVTGKWLGRKPHRDIDFYRKLVLMCQEPIKVL